MRHRKFVLLLVFVPVGLAAGAEDPAVANHVSVLMQQGSAHMHQNRYVEAEASYRASLKACERDEEAKPCEQYPVILSSLGAVYYFKNQFAKAEPLLVQALDYLSGNMNHWEDLSNALYNLAALYRAQARYADAEHLYERALRMIEDLNGGADPSLLPVLNGLAALYQEKGDYQNARREIDRAITISNRHSDTILPDAAASFALLGIILEAQADLEEAESWLSRSLRLRQQLFGLKAAVTADTQVELALVYRREGRLSEAEDLYRRAIATYRDEPAAKYLPVALHNLGQVLIEQQNTKEADRLLREAIAIWEKQLGPEHPDVAAGLTSLGILLTSKNKLSEAESLLRRASDIDQKSLPPNNPQVGYDRENLAAVAVSRKHYAEAQVLLEEAKAILESRLPPSHPEMGRILARLGEVHLRQGDLEQSETLYQGALTILEHAWGQESPLLLPLLENYSVVLRSRKDYAAAASVDMRTMRIRVKQALGTPSRE
jgi:tetratricopeptide (TPR) repeat protein